MSRCSTTKRSEKPLLRPRRAALSVANVAAANMLVLAPLAPAVLGYERVCPAAACNTGCGAPPELPVPDGAMWAPEPNVCLECATLQPGAGRSWCSVDWDLSWFNASLSNTSTCCRRHACVEESATATCPSPRGVNVYRPLGGYSTEAERVVSGRARRPLGIVFGGGGWRSAVISWATARAMAAHDRNNTMAAHDRDNTKPVASLFEYATHFGANSGGSWGAVPLLFSPKFYAALTGSSGLERAINDWAAQFRESVEAALLAHELPTSAGVPSRCPTLKALMDSIEGSNSSYAAWDAGGAWAGQLNATWMEVMLREWVPDPHALSFAAVRAPPFKGATIVLGIAAAGSAYTEDANDPSRHAISFVTVVYSN
eukprot:563307-Prymnesium_polylepis.1